MRSRSKFTAVLCLAVLSVPSFLAAQQNGQVAVTVTGFGVSAAAAEKDALMRAVRVAVGSYVDSETLVRNDRLIKEQILEASGSYVSSYDLVGDPKRRDDGLWEVEVQAIVRGGQVRERLEAVKIVQPGVDTKDVVAEAVTKIENAKQGAAILEKQFPRQMLPRLLVARLIDANGQPTQKISPKTKTLNDGRLSATWNVEIYFNSKAFYDSVVPHLDRVLSGISKASGGPLISSSDTSTKDRGYSAVAAQLTEYPIYGERTWRGKLPDAHAEDSPHAYFMLSTGRSSKGGSERWNWYLLEGYDYIKALSKVNFAAQWNNILLNIDWLAEDGGVVWSNAVNPWSQALITTGYGKQETGHFVPYFVLPDPSCGSISPNVFLSPRFGCAYLGSARTATYYDQRAHHVWSTYGHTDTIVLRVTTVLAPEDLKRIKQVRFHYSLGRAVGDG